MEVHTCVAGWSLPPLLSPLERSVLVGQGEDSCLRRSLGSFHWQRIHHQECEKVGGGSSARALGCLVIADLAKVWKSEACGAGFKSLVKASNPVGVARKRLRASAARAQVATASKKSSTASKRSSSKPTKQEVVNPDNEESDFQVLPLMPVATFRVSDQVSDHISDQGRSQGRCQDRGSAARGESSEGEQGRRVAATRDVGSILDKWGIWTREADDRGVDGKNASVAGLTVQAVTGKQSVPGPGWKRSCGGDSNGKRTDGMIESVHRGLQQGAVCQRGVLGAKRRSMIGGVSSSCQPARMDEGVAKSGGGTLELLFEAMRASEAIYTSETTHMSVRNKELFDIVEERFGDESGASANSSAPHGAGLCLGLGGRELESLGLWNQVPSRKAAKAANGCDTKPRGRAGLKGKDAAIEMGGVCLRAKFEGTSVEGTCPGRRHRLGRSEGGVGKGGLQAGETRLGATGEATGVQRTEDSTGITDRGSTDTAEVLSVEKQDSVELGEKRGKSVGRPRKKVKQPGDTPPDLHLKRDDPQPLMPSVASVAAAEGLGVGIRSEGLTTEGMQSGGPRDGGGAVVTEASSGGVEIAPEITDASPPAEPKKQPRKRRGSVRKEVEGPFDELGLTRGGRLEVKRGRQRDPGKGGAVEMMGGSAGAFESKLIPVSVGAKPGLDKVDAYKDHPLRLQRQRCERCQQDKELADYRRTVSTATGFNSFCRACHAAINAGRRGKVLPQESLDGRTCSDCGRFRSALEFALKRDMPDGLKVCCRACDSLKQADYRDRVNRRQLELTQQQCANCLETKPIGDFNRHRGLVTGHDTYCKQCKRERYLLWKADRRPLERPIVRDKKCARCETTKPASEYALSVTNFDGLQALCRGCVLLTRPGAAGGVCEPKLGRGVGDNVDGMLKVDSA